MRGGAAGGLRVFCPLPHGRRTPHPALRADLSHKGRGEKLLPLPLWERSRRVRGVAAIGERKDKIGENMYQFIFMIHILAAICIVALVLVQQGKGAAMGAAFGSGASQTVFGSRGSGSFLLKLTIGFVVLFFSTSIALNYIATKATKHEAAVTLPAPHETTTAPVSPSSLPFSVPDMPAEKK